MNDRPAVPGADPPRATGWCARLELSFERAGARTVVGRRWHRGPLVVQRPFYPEGGVCHSCIVHPPGGVVGGDSLHVEIDAQAGAQVLVSTPAAGKFYRSAGPVGRVCQQLRVGDATLEWLPQENIFYPDTRARVDCHLHLAAAARFIGWELACLGLPARGEGLAAGVVRQAWDIRREGRPVLLEQVRFDEELRLAPWGLGGCSATGTLIAFPAGPALVAAVRAVDAGPALLSATLLDGVLVVRGTASRTHQLRSAFLRAWEILRPVVCARAASPPRLWAS